MSLGVALGIGSAIAGGIGAVMDWGRKETDWQRQQQNLDRDYNFQREQYEWQKQTDQRNFLYQQELNDREFNYQKELNQLQMEREDSQYQRTVADMRAAGLSPLAMSGIDGSTAGASAGGTAGGLGAGGFSGAGQNNATKAISAFDTITGIISTIEQLETARAQRDKIIAETNAQNTATEWQKRTADMRARQIELTNLLTDENLWSKMNDREYMQKYGLSESMSKEERLAKVISKILGVDIQKTVEDAGGLTGIIKDANSGSDMTEKAINLAESMGIKVPNQVKNLFKEGTEEKPKTTERRADGTINFPKNAKNGTVYMASDGTKYRKTNRGWQVIK